MALANLEELQAAWDEWLVDKNDKGKLTQGAAWRRDNPGEWQQLQTYRAGGTKPALNTRTGRQMVNETAAWLEAKGATDPPDPPDPTPSGYHWHETFDKQPAADWAYEYSGSRVQWPHPAFQLQPTGTGGTCLRMQSPPNAPSGQGVLASMYCFGGSTRARGNQGDTYWLKFRFRFNDQFKGWVFEQHEHYGGPPDIYSNGIRVTPERKLLIQRTGGPASAHPSAEGWHTTDTQTLEPGQWYDILHQVKWSGGTDGFYRVWLNGRQITINHGENYGTLITSSSGTDQVGLGFYAYLYGQNTGPMYTEFDHATQGPTRESVGG